MSVKLGKIRAAFCLHEVKLNRFSAPFVTHYEEWREGKKTFRRTE